MSTNIFNVVLILMFLLYIEWPLTNSVRGDDDQDPVGSISGMEDLDEGDATFVPTNQWQTLKSGQSVPRGSHVRMNLATGVREAKLLSVEDKSDDSETNKQQALLQVQHSDDQVMSMNDLRLALHKITPPPEFDDHTADGIKKFRSIDEIKSQLNALNVTMRSEVEIIRNLLEELQLGPLTTEDDDDVERIVAILNDLEFYVHQYDNAVDFVKMGGFLLLTPLLNSTADEIRSSVAFLLGSAMQSNPSVQMSAADSGLIQRLINRLALETSAAVQSKVLYALSCLLRRFPFAQQKFVDLGGLGVVKKFFDDSDERGNVEEMQRLKLKTITLLYDLIVEHEDVKLQINANFTNNTTEEVEQPARRERQYDAVGLKLAMIEANFCHLVVRLLGTTSTTMVTEHDAIDKILKTMKVMATECRSEFTQLTKRLEQLHQNYQQLVDDDQDDGFFAEINQTVGSLINLIVVSEKRTRNNEL